jgi:hypothetical protein
MGHRLCESTVCEHVENGIQLGDEARIGLLTDAIFAADTV